MGRGAGPRGPPLAHGTQEADLFDALAKLRVAAKEVDRQAYALVNGDAEQTRASAGGEAGARPGDKLQDIEDDACRLVGHSGTYDVPLNDFRWLIAEIRRLRAALAARPAGEETRDE